MKQIFLSALVLLSVLVSGCYDNSSDIKNTDKSERISAEKPESKEHQELSQDGGTITPKVEEKPADKETQTAQSPSDDKSTESTDSEQKKPKSDSVSEESTAPAIRQPSPSEGTPETKPAEAAAPEKIFLNDNFLIAAGIIVALLVSGILIWLINDRRKMKRKLKDLTNQPPNQNNQQENVSNPQPSPAVTTTTMLTVRVAKFQHIGSRKEQQDSYDSSDIEDKNAVRAKGFMAVVADGMGGLEGGAAISKLVTDTFINNYNNQVSFDAPSFLYQAGQSAELAVENYMNHTKINGGSTVVAVVIKDDRMNYISVGDSHLYLLRNNNLTLLNKEHSFGELLKEKAARGEVSPEEPYINPKRNALTAYIGIGNFNTTDRNSQPIMLQEDDKILLCSDGVYNALEENELKASLAGDVESVAQRMQANILAKAIPSQDNFTAIILECVKI